MKKETKTRLPLAPKPAPHPRKNHIKTTQNIPRLVRHPHSCTTKNAPKRKPANYRKKQRFLQLLHTALVKQETGVQSQNSANAEFWSFCTRLLLKHEFPDAKAKLCATKKPANYRKKRSFLQFWHTALVKQETGKQSENSASPNSRVLAHGVCARDGFFDAKTSLPFV